MIGIDERAVRADAPDDRPDFEDVWIKPALAMSYGRMGNSTLAKFRASGAIRQRVPDGGKYSELNARDVYRVAHALAKNRAAVESMAEMSKRLATVRRGEGGGA